MAAEKNSRKQQILQSLALMLEETPGGKITTAKLASKVGVSEAALYRHFASKTKMYESLIDFIEDTLFSRIRIILTEESDAADRCYRILTLMLTFSERNPGGEDRHPTQDQNKDGDDIRKHRPLDEKPSKHQLRAGPTRSFSGRGRRRCSCQRCKTTKNEGTKTTAKVVEANMPLAAVTPRS